MLMVLKLLLTMVDHQLSWDENEVDDVVIVYLILARVVCVIRPDDGPVVMRIIRTTGQLIPNRGGENDNNNVNEKEMPTKPYRTTNIDSCCYCCSFIIFLSGKCEAWFTRLTNME
jgi:hypothetical protein